MGRNWIGVMMNDLINRQQAINALYEINPSSDFLFIDAIVDMLENLPEPTTKVVLQGNYIFNGFITAGGTCGNCSNAVAYGDKYCSICGKKLDWTN